jgi:hypothetical protein
LSGNAVGSCFYDLPVSVAVNEIPADVASLSRTTRYKLKRIPGGVEVAFDFNSSYDEYLGSPYLLGTSDAFYIYVAIDADAGAGYTTCQIETWGHWEVVGRATRAYTTPNPNHTDIFTRLQEAVSTVLQSLAHVPLPPADLVKKVLMEAGLPAAKTLLSIEAQRYLSSQLRQVTL